MSSRSATWAGAGPQIRMGERPSKRILDLRRKPLFRRRARYSFVNRALLPRGKGPSPSPDGALDPTFASHNSCPDRIRSEENDERADPRWSDGSRSPAKANELHPIAGP